MGDIADWLLASQNPFDDDHDEAAEYGGRQPSVACCKRCGALGIWHHTGERWRLIGTGGRLHECYGAASVDEFEDLS